MREGFWAVTLSEKASTGGGRLSLLADEFRYRSPPPPPPHSSGNSHQTTQLQHHNFAPHRFELRTPRGDLLTELSVCGKDKAASFATVSFAYHGTMGEVRVAPRWPRAAVSFDSFRQLQMFLRKCIAGARVRLGCCSALDCF